MSMPDDDNSLLAGLDLTPDNDDEDLSKLDRGDTVDDDDGEDDDASKDAAAAAAAAAAKDNGKDGGAGGDGKDGKDASGKDGKDKSGKEGKDDGKGGKEEGEEDDDEEEDDENADGDGTGAADGDKSTPARVRRAQRQRDAERQRAEAAERELAAFKSGQKSVVPKNTGPTESEKISTELEELYEQVENLRADGNTKDAAKVQREIDTKNRQLSHIENEAASQKREAAREEDRRYNSYIDRLEAEYPELNPEDDDYDAAKVQRIMRGVERSIRAGLTPSDALAETVDLIYGLDVTKAPSRKATKDDKAGKAAKGDKTDKDDKAVKDAAAAALVEARRKKAEAAGKQPADTSRRGADAAGDDTRIDPSRLTDEDFDKLPRSTLEKMRGDHLT